jgi:hypothetical protein
MKLCRSVLLFVVALSLSCGGPGDKPRGRLQGRVFVSSPLAGAVVLPAAVGSIVPTDSNLLGANNTAYVLNGAVGTGPGPLYDVAGNVIAFQTFTVRNGTNYPVILQLRPNVSATWSGTVYDHNPLDGTIANQQGPSCTSTAFTLPLTGSACKSPNPTTRPLSGAVAGTGDGAFTKNIRAFIAGGSERTLVSCGSACWEVTLDGVATSVDVYLLTSKFTFLWDGSAGTVSTRTNTLLGTSQYTVFGLAEEPWGENMTDSDTGLVFVQKHKRMKYLQTVSVQANNTGSTGDRVEFMTRFSTTGAETIAGAPMMNTTFQYSTTENQTP